MNSAPFHQSDRGARLERASLMRAIVSPTRSSSAQSSVLSPQHSQLELYIQKPHPLLTPSDLAPDWELCETQIIELIDEGKLVAFYINKEDQPQHRHYRILRHLAVRGQLLTDAGFHEVIQTVDTWLFPVERWGRRQVFRVDHAAEILDISPRHVRKLYDADQLGARNLGLGQKELSLRIPRAAIVAFVQRRLALQNGIQ